MEVRVGHELGREGASERLRAAAEKLGMELDVPPGTYEGEIERATPLGSVKATLRVLDDAVEVDITEKPAFLPEGTIRRAIEDGLSEALAG